MPQSSCLAKETFHMSSIDEQVSSLLAQMTLEEKIGQMSQVNGGGWDLHQAIRAGQVGSVLNEVNVHEEADKVIIHSSNNAQLCYLIPIQ